MTSTPVLGIVHTSFALVELLNNLVKAQLPGVQVVNVVDDTLLSYARERGVDDALRRRMRNYFNSAADAGAQVILNACSSVGETVDTARDQVPVPILKIDEAMAAKAVRAGRRIAVLATVASTLGPTGRLLRKQAEAAGRQIEIDEVLCEGAFDLLLAGKTDEHDRRVKEAVVKAAQGHEVLVFAQASMSRLVPSLAGQIQVPLLASPELAMARLREMFQELGAKAS
ncbi:MAG TPA: aspartate/glutamate racemase family protein [Lacunisphaera sp.]|nr:aspartate/glutamate racemase family protein [Lacunisphaera sp.]